MKFFADNADYWRAMKYDEELNAKAWQLIQLGSAGNTEIDELERIASTLIAQQGQLNKVPERGVPNR